MAFPSSSRKANYRSSPPSGKHRFRFSWRQQGCSKVGPSHSKPEIRRPKAELIATPEEQPPIELGHSQNSELPQITQMGADNKAGRPAGRLRHCPFPICEYLRHLRLRNSDFGLLSGFGLRSSDFRAAEQDIPSTGRSLVPPCRVAATKEPAGRERERLHHCSQRQASRMGRMWLCGP